MLPSVQIQFEKKMERRVKGYSPLCTQALATVDKVAAFLAYTAFFGVLLASNFVNIPKWGVFGIGIGGAVAFGLISTVLQSVVKNRKEQQHAREDALSMAFGSSITPVGESELPSDQRFRTEKLQGERGQAPPPSTRTLRALADRYGLDVPAATASQILHNRDNPVHLGVQVSANKEANLNPENFERYQKTHAELSAGVVGPLFKEAGCQGMRIVTKKIFPAAWEVGLSESKRQLLDHWRFASVLLKLFIDKPFEATQQLVSAGEVGKENWIEKFGPVLEAMGKEIERLDFGNYVERRKQRLRLASKELIEACKQSPLQADATWTALQNTILNGLELLVKRDFTVEKREEVVEIEQTIATVLKLKRELAPRSSVDPCQTPTLVDKLWQTQVAALRKGLELCEGEAKQQKLAHFMRRTSHLPAISRRALYRQLLDRLDPIGYAQISEKREVLYFRRRLEALQPEQIDFKVLDDRIGHQSDMRAYAQKIGHPHLDSSTSLRQPLIFLKARLAEIELALQNNEEGALERLTQFHKREYAATIRYLMFQGKSRMALIREKTLLAGSPETLPLLSDDPESVQQKRVRRSHYKQILRQDLKTYQLERLGLGVGIPLITAAIAIAALFVKSRYASIALSGAGLLSIGVGLYGGSHVDGMLRRKRVLQMREHLYMHGGRRPVQGSEARRVKGVCDALGIDGELAIAHAVIHRERQSFSVGERLRGLFIQSSGQKRAARIAMWHAPYKEPVMAVIRAAARQHCQRESARQLIPYVDVKNRTEACRLLTPVYGLRNAKGKLAVWPPQTQGMSVV